MYRAKADGKARHAVFDAQMHRHVARAPRPGDRPAPRDRVAAALQVLYQPILRTGTGEITAFEALCRWEVEPHEFVAIAEETGLIVPLGALRAARGGRGARRSGA